ncbi:Leucine-rich repeat-containing protein 40 [Geranomyces variabilis]|uniref:Leucine-rich repeat-containing protein 40 n=1 Tax=Geranomyces variabilis TaxID=109894 RepID=A0AAD5TPQ2_9FUNG|nr:Leucine-rich repeat-containing protein 40 [Geranomyces variabilis]
MLRGSTPARPSPATTTPARNVSRFKRPQAAFAAAAAQTEGRENTIKKIIAQSRASGRLNLSNQQLTTVPDAVFAAAEPEARSKAVDFSFDRSDDGGANWWEAVELLRLLLADNALNTLDPRIGTFTSLAILDVRNNQLTCLPEELGALEQLAVLNVSGNQLTELPDVLARLPIVDLNLANNNFETLADNVVGRLAKLQTLDVSGNALAALPGNLPLQLTTLILAKNKLRDLDGVDLARLALLSDLDVSDNVLTSVVTSASTIPALVRLDLRRNKLRGAFPGVELNLPTCKELYASFNALTSFTPGFIGSAAMLRTLDFCNNAVTELPAEILGLKELKRLDLSNNNVRTLPPELGLLEGIDVLLFAGNPLRGVPTGSTQRVLAMLRDKIVHGAAVSSTPSSAATSRASTPVPGSGTLTPSAQESHTRTVDLSQRGLTTLDAGMFDGLAFTPATLVLHHNRFETFPAAGFTGAIAASLSTLVLSHNRLSALPTEAAVLLPNLRHLDLSCNALTQLPATAATPFPSLQELVISRNRLAGATTITAENLAGFPRLESLIAAACGLSAIDADAFLAADTLRVLDLADNDIAAVPPRLGLCKGLKTLRLGGNRFRVPRRDIVDRGCEAILAYLKDRIPT